MKCFLWVTGYEVRHGFLSLRFWGTVAAFTAMLLLDSWTDIYNAHTQDYYTSDIIYLALNSMMGFSYMFWLRFCLFGIPYGCSFYDEYSTKSAKYRLVRTSSVPYGMSKMTVNAVLAASAVLLSQLLFLVLMLLQGFPLLDEHNQYITVYSLLESGKAAEFYLVLSIFNCFAAVFFSAVTMMLSAFLRNKYILVAMPLILFFCLDYFGGLWYPYDYEGTRPVLTNLRTVFFRLLYDGRTYGTEREAFLRTAIYTLAVFAIFSLVFIRRVREVVDSE